MVAYSVQAFRHLPGNNVWVISGYSYIYGYIGKMVLTEGFVSCRNTLSAASALFKIMLLVVSSTFLSCGAILMYC